MTLGFVRGSLLAVLLGATGCGACDGATKTDERRLDFLKAEPLLEEAVDVPIEEAGFEISGKLSPRRGEILAVLSSDQAADPVGAARERTASAAATLRDTGWTVYFVACVPPSGEFVANEGASAVPVADETRWQFFAYAYKVDDGVSYYAHIDGYASTDGKADVWLGLRAPNSHEETTDLFPDRPDALDANSTCLESADPPDQSSLHGLAVIVGSHGPDPDGTEMATGFR